MSITICTNPLRTTHHKSRARVRLVVDPAIADFVTNNRNQEFGTERFPNGSGRPQVLLTTHSKTERIRPCV